MCDECGGGVKEERGGVLGEGVPAFTVKQRHLEAFTSALTQRVAQAQQLHH